MTRAFDADATRFAHAEADDTADAAGPTGAGAGRADSASVALSAVDSLSAVEVAFALPTSAGFAFGVETVASLTAGVTDLRPADVDVDVDAVIVASPIFGVFFGASPGPALGAVFREAATRGVVVLAAVPREVVDFGVAGCTAAGFAAAAFVAAGFARAGFVGAGRAGVDSGVAALAAGLRDVDGRDVAGLAVAGFDVAGVAVAGVSAGFAVGPLASGFPVTFARVGTGLRAAGGFRAAGEVRAADVRAGAACAVTSGLLVSVSEAA